MAEEVAQAFTLNVDPTLKNLNAVADAVDRMDTQIAQATQSGRDNFQRAAAAAVEYSNKIAAATAEQRAAAAATREAQAAVRELTRASQQLETAMKRANSPEEAKRLQRELDKNTQKIREAKVAIEENRRATDQERKSVEDVREARRQEANAARLAAAAAKDAAAAAKQQAAAAKEQVGSLKGEADKGGSSIAGMFGRFASAAGATAAVGYLVGKVKDLAFETIEAGKKADAILGKLQFARGGDLEKTAGDVASLRFEVDRLGLDVNSAGASYGSFTAAATAANLPLAEARRLYLAVAGAAATLRISSADTEGSLLALQQMVSKGTVSAEELRGQLGERLPGAFSLAAKAIGVTEQQLGKMLQRGEIVATDFLPKFARELEKTFGDGSAAAADALQANTNRIDNEWQRFLLRFQSNAGSAVSSLAKFAKETNDFLDALTPAGRIRLGAQQAQAELKGYDRVFAAIAKQAEVAAKAAGQPIQAAGTAALNQEERQITARLTLAQRRLEAISKQIESSTFGANSYQKEEQQQAAKQVALLKGQQQAIEDLRAARKKAAEDEGNNLQGLIEKQQLLIKQLQERQKNATLENKGTGADFLFGKGGLNKQLEDAQKELDRLLGKVEKVRKQQDDRLAAALRALYRERETLASLAEKAEIKTADSARERADEQLKADLRGIEKVKQALIEREQAVRKAGGRGANADGVIDGTQARELNKLREAAEQKHADEIFRINQELYDRLLSLQADSDEKEREQLERQFEAQKLAARGQTTVLLAIEQERQRALLALDLAQSQRRAERERAFATTNSETNALIYGRGTGRSVFEAQRAQRLEQIDIDRQFYEQQLRESLKAESEKGRQLRAEARKQLRLLQLERDKVIQEGEEFSLYKLILGDSDSEETRAALDTAVRGMQDALVQIQQFTQAQIAASQAVVAAKTTQISETQAALQAEILLNKEGSASNVQTKREELAALKRERQQALAEQRQAQRAQLLLDTVAQSSSLFTAVANIFMGTSKLDMVLPGLGIAVGTTLSGVLIGAFVASKLKALSAINNSGAGGGGEGFFKGGFTGGNSVHEERGPVHGKEFVFDNEKTAKHRAFFELLHNDRPISWADPALDSIRPMILGDPRLPSKMLAAQSQVQQLTLQHQGARDLKRMHDRLEAIERNTATSATRSDVVSPAPGVVLEIDSNGNTKQTTYPHLQK